MNDSMKGLSGIYAIMILLFGVIALMGLASISPSIQQNLTPPAPSPPTFTCEAGYLYYANITLSNVYAKDVVEVNLPSNNITALTPRAEEVYCVNRTGSPVQYQTLINGLYYAQHSSGFNASANHQTTNVTFLFVNDTGIFQERSVYCMYGNTSSKVDRSKSIVLWLDNFESTAVGTLPAKATSTVSASLGGVCATNGEQAVGCGITGGQSTSWNLTEFSDFTARWKINNSASNTNDVLLNIYQTNGYRMPQTNPNNNYQINFNGGASLGGISFTGSATTPYTIINQRNGSSLHLYLDYNRVLNVTSTTRTQGSVIAWAVGISLKGLTSLEVYNLTAQLRQNPTAVSVTTHTCS